MTFKDKLIWLKGKKVALCETNEQRFTQVKQFLQRYDIEVIGLQSAERMLADLESRRYSTHRVFLAVFISADLALALEKAWQEITTMNPSITKTPLVLTSTLEEKTLIEPLIAKGYFRFCLTQPIAPQQVLRVLRKLNRWKVLRGDISRSAILNN